MEASFPIAMRTSGGESDSDAKELTVIPLGLPWASRAVTTVTPLANRPKSGAKLGYRIRAWRTIRRESCAWTAGGKQGEHDRTAARTEHNPKNNVNLQGGIA